MNRMRRIVLTGGPGAGKTVVATRLAAGCPDRFAVVPEAATLVYQRLGKRWSQLDVAGRRDVQRQIYRLQLEQDEAASASAPGLTLLLDRGTVDGAAYWPDGPEDYWRQLGTALNAECARYDAVIWLQTSAAIGEYDGGASNSARHEAAPVAIALGQQLRELWSHHAHFYCVDAYPTIERKIATVEQIIQNIIDSGLR
jgi:predicted ATPase